MSNVATSAVSPKCLAFIRSKLLWIFAILAFASAGGSAALAATVYPGGVWEPGPAKYGSVVVEDVPVTMDDGVVLKAVVAYPTDLATGQRAAGRFPVVFEHTPYVRLGQPVVPNKFLTEHGYIYAVVRARGAGASGGEMQYFSARDGLDGKALVNWAARDVEGADGRVAILGCSWAGGLAITGAAFVGPNSPVKAVIAGCMGLSGLQRQTLLVSGLQTTRMGTFATGLLPFVGNSPSASKVMTQIANDIASGGDAAYDLNYWSERRPLSLAQRVVDNGLPVLLWTGWEDYVDIGAIRTYVALQNAYARRSVDAPIAPDLSPTPRYQLVVGGWGHAVGLDAGVYLQWLETWVKDVDTGIQKTTTPMHVFETGSNRWINLAGYPAVADYTPWQLEPGGALTSGPSTRGERKLVWDYPSKPDALLTFTTPPLAQGATLAGPISATVFASSTNTNLVIIARLMDVAPDGKETEISRGAILGSQRELDKDRTWTDRKGAAIWPWPTLKGDSYLAPGQVYRFDIALAPRQAGIAPGHRIRLALSTRSPEDICPQEGLPPRSSSDVCALTTPQQKTVPGGTYTVLFGPDHPSALNLPQLPWQHFREAGTTYTPTGWTENTRQITKSLGLPRNW